MRKITVLALIFVAALASSGRANAEAKLDAPADQRPILGGRRGHHSEHLGHLLAVMQFLPRTYPDAAW